MKRSPVNLRPLFRVPPGHNPKGIALFLSALVSLAQAGEADAVPMALELVDRLLALRSKGHQHACWGYNFDWQTRTYLVPRGTPNIICTTFACNALLDAYVLLHDQRCLDASIDACRFLLEQLYVQDGSTGEAWFNYTPLARSQIHNANLLGAALFCRVSKACADSRLLEPAIKATRFSTQRQRSDGAWPYGESARPSQQWVDNFHTGYNLCALRDIGTYAATDEFEACARRGFAFYRSSFFLPDGAPRFTTTHTYPIDIHSVSQSILTLLAFRDESPDNEKLAHTVFQWAMRHMWNRRDGCFYYQRFPALTIKIPYMRWGQAWMLVATSSLAHRAASSLPPSAA